MRNLLKWGLGLLLAGAVIMILSGLALGPRVATLTTVELGHDPYRDVDATYRAEEPVSRLVLNVSIGEIRIHSGETFAIRTHGLKKAGEPMEHGRLTEFGVYEGEATLRTVYEGHGVNYTDGDIVVDVTLPASVKELEAEVNLGSLRLQAVDLDTADLTVDLGNLEYEGTITGLLTATANMGDLTLDLKQDQPALDLQVGMGDLDVNGRSVDGTQLSVQNLKPEDKAAVKAETGMGSLSVRTGS